MKWVLRAAGCVAAAVVIVAGVVTVTLIRLMFASGSTEGRRLGFFDSLFVDVDQRADGTTGLEVGLLNPVPLAITAAILVVLLLATLTVHDMLVERRRQLLAEAE